MQHNTTALEITNHKHLQFIEKTDFIVFKKPTHLRLNKFNAQQTGLVDVLKEMSQCDLYPMNNLLPEASGLILLSKNKDLLKTEIKKTYYFLTNSQNSSIPREFNFISSVGKNRLFKIEKTQLSSEDIQLLASKNNFPIVGDQKNNGSKWFRLALHLGELEFTLNSENFHFKQEIPSCFKTDEDELIHLFKDHWESLNNNYNLQKNSCYRLVHKSIWPLQADIYGDVLWVYWYFENEISDLEFKALEKFSESIDKKLIVRHMINRGTGVGGQNIETLKYSQNAPKEWTVQENGIQYLLKQNSGFSPGLFLDQSENRYLIYKNSKNKKVLNLFSYTSGFSVAAALGEATSVTTVDASTSFLNWSRENFRKNELNDTNYEFFTQDVLLFLNGSKKRNRKWDIIICDPPSFGRTKNTLWKIDRDLPELALLLTDCLEKNGIILFTSNFEKWSLDELKKMFFKKLNEKKFEIKSLPHPSLDFDLLDSVENLTKGFIVSLK